MLMLVINLPSKSLIASANPVKRPIGISSPLIILAMVSITKAVGSIKISSTLALSVVK